MERIDDAIQTTTTDTEDEGINFFEKVKEEENIRYRANASEAIKESPSQLKEIEQLSARYQRPISFIRNNLDGYREQAKKDDLDNFRKDNPVAAARALDKGKLSTISDNMEKSARFAALTRRYDIEEPPPSKSEAFGVGVDQLKQSIALTYGALSGSKAAFEQVAEYEKGIQDYNRRLQEYYGEYFRKSKKEGAEASQAWDQVARQYEKEWEGNYLSELAELADLTGDALSEQWDKTRHTDFSAEIRQNLQSAPSSFGPAIITALGALAGAKTGGAAGGAIGMAIPAPGTTAPMAAIGATVGGTTGALTTGFTANTVLNFAGSLKEQLIAEKVDFNNPEQLQKKFNDKEFIDAVKEGALKKGVTVAAVETLLDVVAGGILSRAFKSTRLASKTVKGTAALGVESFGEGAGEVSGEFARTGEVTGETLVQGFDEMKAALYLGGGGAAISISAASAVQGAQVLNQSKVEAEASKTFSESLKEAGSDAQELAETDPDLFADIANSESNGQAVFFQAEEFKNHWENLGENAAEKADELLPRGRAQLQQALDEGEMLQVPLGDLMTKFSREESFDQLADMARRSKQAMNATEADSLMGQFSNLVKQVSNQAREELQRSRQREDTRMAVERDIEGQLIAAGVSSKEAKKVSRLSSSGLNALSDRFLNEDAVDLMARRRLEIAREGDADGRVLLQRDKTDKVINKLNQDPLGFYSNLGGVVSDIDFKTMPAKDLANRIKKTEGIKKDELEWTGIIEMLEATEGKISKEDVIAFLENGGPQFEEVVLQGEGLDIYGTPEGETKYEQYSLPGGENYREVLLRLPREKKNIPQMNFKDWNEANDTGLTDEEIKAEFEARDGALYNQWREEQDQAFDEAVGKGEYKSSHWDETNVLAHFRLKDFTDAEGRKTLLIDEIQSDWHQEGRRKGYQGEISKEFVAPYKEEMAETTGRDIEDITDNEVVDYFGLSAQGVPNAPFKATEAWSLLAFKRILRMAAEQGYETVAWTPGEVQAERYDLSNQVDAVSTLKKDDGTYHVEVIKNGGLVNEQTLQESELEANLGKDLAEKIINQEGKKEASGYYTYEGLDLKVGGEGMIGFYDKMLPKTVDKYVRKLDKKAKVGVGKIETEAIGKDPAVARLGDGWYVTDEQTEEQRGPFPTRDEAIEAGKDNTQQVWQVPVTDKLREKVLQGQPLFQKDGRRTRGFTDLNDATKIVIGLLEGRNKSTALHEMGHAFLEYAKLAHDELLTRDPDTFLPKQRQALEDVRTIFEFLGVQSFDEIKTEHHEKFARSFEAYLMEGKAPSKRLKRAFAAFRTWLVNIYRSIKGIEAAGEMEINLTDEVRETFDRMLATEDEINEVTREKGYTREFIDNMFSKITANEKDLEDLYNAHEDAKIDAEQELFQKEMEKLRKKKTKEYNAKKKELTEKYTEEANNVPLYRAIEAIRTGEIDGSPVLGISTLKLNSEQVRNYIAQSDFESFPQSLYSAEGADINLVADVVGFPNGASLIEAIAANPSKKQFIDLSVQRELADAYPELEDDMQALKLDALEEVDKPDSRKRALKLELNILLQNSPAQAKKLYNKLIKRAQSDKQLKQAAANRVGSTSYRDASTAQLNQLETRARNQKAAFMNSGDIEKALDQALKETFAYEMKRDANARRDKVDKQIDQNKKRLGRQSDKELSKRGNVDMMKVAQTILANYGILTDVQVDNLAVYLDQLQRYDAEAYNKVAGLTRALLTIEPGNYKDLAVGDLEEVLETVDSIYTLAREEKTITVDGEKVDRDQAVRDMTNALTSQKKRAVKREDEKYAKTRMAVLSAEAGMTRMEHLINAFDKGEILGPFRKYFWNRANDAQTNYVEQRTKRYEQFNEILKEHFKDTFQDKEQINLNQYFPNAEAQNRVITKKELVMALLHSGNESNKRKLLLGRGWGIENMDGDLDSSAYDAFINDMIERGILNKNIFDGVQKVWDLFEDIKPEVQKTHKAVYGYFFREIEPQSFETPFGTYRGGYAPAITDPLQVQVELERIGEASTELSDNTYSFASTPKGFTKERVQAYNKALSLNFDMLRGHIEKTVRFHTIEEAVQDLNKLLKQPQLKDSLFEVNNYLVAETFNPFVARLATQQTMKPPETGVGRKIGEVLQFLNTSAKAQLMFINIKNSLENVLEFSAMYARVDRKYLHNALKRYVGNRKETANFVYESSADMKQRMDENIYEINNAYYGTIKPHEGTWGKLRETREFLAKNTYIMQRFIQDNLEIVAWLGSYDQGIAKGLSHEQAVRDADSTIRTTVGSNRPIDIASVEAGNVLQRMLLSFYSFFNNKYNVIRYAPQDVRNKTIAFGFFAPAILSALWRKTYEDDWDVDEDGYVDDALDVAIGAPLRFGAATIPYGGTVQRFIEGQFTKVPYDDKLALPPVVSMINNLGDPIKVTTDVLTGEEIRGREVRDSLYFLGTVSGVPVGPLGRPIGFFIDLETGKQSAETPLEYVRGTVTGRSGRE